MSWKSSGVTSAVDFIVGLGIGEVQCFTWMEVASLSTEASWIINIYYSEDITHGR